MNQRLKKLTETREAIRQALLGCQWEERYDLWKLESIVIEEIRLEMMREESKA